jgi:hypothetical protein
VVEVADIFRTHGTAYRQTHPLARAQRRALHAIETCRTAALGGLRDTCDTCGAVQISYNSCRNRHCPKCQTLAKARWLDARRADLLAVEYFHLVFTLPHTLNPLAQGNPRVIYTLLFHAVADTLTTFARDPRHLGGDLGGTAILHTWGQNLSQHFHLHCVVTGGARSEGVERPPAREDEIEDAVPGGALGRRADAVAEECAAPISTRKAPHSNWSVWSRWPIGGRMVGSHQNLLQESCSESARLEGTDVATKLDHAVQDISFRCGECPAHGDSSSAPDLQSPR